MKRCGKCKLTKPFSDFYPRSDGHGDGYFRLCKGCESARQRARYLKNIVKERIRSNKKHFAYKLAAFEHYGKECVCCGENRLVFLALDHINGGGNQERKKASKSGRFGCDFYVYLKTKGYPGGIQVLCHNCNWAKSHGGCPHKLV